MSILSVTKFRNLKIMVNLQNQLFIILAIITGNESGNRTGNNSRLFRSSTKTITQLRQQLFLINF